MHAFSPYWKSFQFYIKSTGRTVNAQEEVIVVLKLTKRNMMTASNQPQTGSLGSTSSFNLTEALHMDFEVGLRPNNQ